MRVTLPIDLTPLAMRRSLDVAHFNGIANDPSVRPTLGGDGPMDLRPVIENLRNFAFKTPHGGYVLLDCGSGRYDVHSFFLPEGRGKEAMDAMREVAAYMFMRTDCTEGRTTIPEGNTGAAALATRGGFEPRFTLDRMVWKANETTSAVFMALTLEKWMLTSPLPLAAGQWFHRQLDAVKSTALHPDEAVHDRMAGAVVLLTRCGQHEKAVAFYNAFALAANYATISLASRTRPIVLDIVDALIEVTEDGMEILTCR
jgi:hypothetical protein